MAEQLNGVSEEEESPHVWVHLRISEGRGFVCNPSRLDLIVRFMGWERRKSGMGSSSSLRPKWDLNELMSPFPFEAFRERSRENNLLILLRENEGSHGRAFIPLDPFFAALEVGSERLLADNYPYPIIGFSDWAQVKDPLLPESEVLGELNVQLTAGSKKQIQNYTKFHNYEEPPISPEKTIISSPIIEDEEEASPDFLINISVTQGRSLPQLKDRSQTNPNSYVSFENKFYSGVQFNTRSPKWDFSVSGLALKPDKRYLIIRIWHSNSNTNDEVLGFAAIDLFPSGEDEFKDFSGWQNLLDFSGRLKGEIEVEISAYKGSAPSKAVPLFKKPEHNVLTNNFISNLKMLEELSSNLKARLRLRDELSQVCSLDFESLKSKEGERKDMPDLGDINWEEVMEVTEGGLETRRTADGESAAEDMNPKDSSLT